MTVLGIHATGTHLAERILASGFLPGRSLANYLGEGTYFYLIHGQGGYRNAAECAEKVARRHHRRISLLKACICVDKALNLQNPAVRPQFAAFGEAFDARLHQLGLCVQPNDNASYYRPLSHLKIEAFRRVIEAVSGRDFDVLSARFALKSHDIDIELPPEICVKRARAIISVELVDRLDEGVVPSLDPANWPCEDGVIQAARDAGRAVSTMDSRDLTDLIFSIYQGSDCGWTERLPRFAGAGAVHFLYDSRDHPRGVEVARSVAEAGQQQSRKIHLVDFMQLEASGTSRAQNEIAKLLESTAGIVSLLASKSVDVVSSLTSVADRRPEVPILAFTASKAADMSDMPIMLRSRHNVCCMALPQTDSLSEILTGFMHDRWTDALAVSEIESKMAARHGSMKMRHCDARKIVEAFHARQRVLL